MRTGENVQSDLEKRNNRPQGTALSSVACVLAHAFHVSRRGSPFPISPNADGNSVAPVQRDPVCDVLEVKETRMPSSAPRREGLLRSVRRPAASHAANDGANRHAIATSTNLRSISIFLSPPGALVKSHAWAASQVTSRRTLATFHRSACDAQRATSNRTVTPCC